MKLKLKIAIVKHKKTKFNISPDFTDFINSIYESILIL